MHMIHAIFLYLVCLNHLFVYLSFGRIELAICHVMLISMINKDVIMIIIVELFSRKTSIIDV